MTRFEIRHAAEPDKAALRDLLRRLHPMDQADSATLPHVRQRNQTFVATRAERVVGMALVTFVDYGVEAYGMIEELVVDEAHRGDGIGRGLLAKCQAWFDANDAEVVFVSAATEDVIGFYRTAGFDRCTGPWLARARSRTPTTVEEER